MAAGRVAALSAVVAAVAVAPLLLAGVARGDCFDYCFKNCTANDKSMTDYCNYACGKTCEPRAPQRHFVAADSDMRCQLSCARSSCHGLRLDGKAVEACFGQCYGGCTTKTLPRPLRAGAGVQPFHEKQDGVQPFHEKQDGVQPTSEAKKDAAAHPFHEKQDSVQPFHEKQDGVQPVMESKKDGAAHPFHEKQDSVQPFHEKQDDVQPASGPIKDDAAVQPFHEKQEGVQPYHKLGSCPPDICHPASEPRKEEALRGANPGPEIHTQASPAHV